MPAVPEMTRKLSFPSLSTFFERSITSSKSSFALFVCLLAVTLAYRVQLTISLFTSPARPFDFDPSSHPFWVIFSYFSYDLALVIGCFLVSWVFSRVGPLMKKAMPLTLLKILGLLSLNTVLLALVLVHGIHGRLLFYVQSGLDSRALLEASSGIPFGEVIKLVGTKDYLFLFLPIGLFWLVLLSPLAVRVWLGRVSIALSILLLSISLIGASSKRGALPAEIRLNPALFLLSDVVGNAFHRQVAEGRGRTLIDEKKDVLKEGASATGEIEPVKTLPAKSDHPWNIVFFIMESAGTRYVFDESHGHPMPMPFLNRLAKEGWFLKRHHTTSNVSTKAVFSLLSGLYDFFNRDTFSLRPDATVPSVYNYLGKHYDTFLVTPSSKSWYFPAGFVKNSGLPEMHSYENLDFRIKETFHSLGHYIARDEVQTTDFFIRRLSGAREPFFGIYISFAAHFPYFDYGADYRVMDGDESLRGRYYNNLNLLDRMIRRVYEHLEKQGLLERTIFVIVGDHGQAFGQHHSNNYMHYRYSYSENLEAPAILYQPMLFKPKTFETPTTHVDLLPTLLDATGTSYDPLHLDGESLFETRPGRRYIYFYGYEESISSLDADFVKVQCSLKKDRCWAFDLRVDPDEKNPLDASSYPVQLEDLRRFVREHDSKLIKYNESVRGERGSAEQKPPSL